MVSVVPDALYIIPIPLGVVGMVSAVAFGFLLDRMGVISAMRALRATRHELADAMRWAEEAQEWIDQADTEKALAVAQVRQELKQEIERLEGQVDACDADYDLLADKLLDAQKQLEFKQGELERLKQGLQHVGSVGRPAQPLTEEQEELICQVYSEVGSIRQTTKKLFDYEGGVAFDKVKAVLVERGFVLEQPTTKTTTTPL
jgi:DNA repair exonuclease SbcCD ATPase subunit